MSIIDPSLRDLIVETRNDVKWIKDDLATVAALKTTVERHDTFFRILYWLIGIIGGLFGWHIKYGAK